MVVMIGVARIKPLADPKNWTALGNSGRGAPLDWGGYSWYGYLFVFVFVFVFVAARCSEGPKEAAGDAVPLASCRRMLAGFSGHAGRYTAVAAPVSVDISIFESVSVATSGVISVPSSITVPVSSVVEVFIPPVVEISVSSIVAMVSYIV
jgi:hypothetical protein